jgi:hypothetical protein
MCRERQLLAEAAVGERRSDRQFRAHCGLSLSVEFAPTAFCGETWRAALQRVNRTFVRSAAKIEGAFTVL